METERLIFCKRQRNSRDVRGRKVEVERIKMYIHQFPTMNVLIMYCKHVLILKRNTVALVLLWFRLSMSLIHLMWLQDGLLRKWLNHRNNTVNFLLRGGPGKKRQIMKVGERVSSKGSSSFQAPHWYFLATMIKQLYPPWHTLLPLGPFCV